MMKLFGRKGKSIRIEVILAIVIILLVLCIGFGYCLRFTQREGNENFIVSAPGREWVAGWGWMTVADSEGSAGSAVGGV